MTLESQSCLETPTKYLHNYITNSNDTENNGNNNAVSIVCHTRSSSNRNMKNVNNNVSSADSLISLQSANTLCDNEIKKSGGGPILRSSARVPKRTRECDSVTSDCVGGGASGNNTSNKKVATSCSKVDNNRLEQAKTRRTWELWSVEDKNSFFEALCEYGKDFENIQNYIVQKTRKKGHSPPIIKNKDQVRHFYYRTWHKIAKHLYIDNDVKKQVQELYGLINYGELRKKIGGRLDEKNGQKLKELVHSGVTIVRCKGKNVRIKTPVCRALKKLNDVEISKDGDNTKLPSRILLEVRPRNNRSWSLVQSFSQNPRVRMDVSLQCRLAVILRYLEDRWRSSALKQRDEVISQYSESKDFQDELPLNENTCTLKLFPQKGDIINPVCVKTHVEVSNLNVSLQNYRFKKGIDTVATNSMHSEVTGCCTKKGLKNKSKLLATLSKDDKIANDNENNLSEITENGLKELSVSLPAHEVTMRQLLALETAAVEPVTLSFLKDSSLSPTINTAPVEASKTDGCKSDCSKDDSGSKTIFIKPGWSSKTCNSLTIGEVYLMLGKPQKLVLEYEWEFESPCSSRTSLSSVLTRLLQLASITYSDLNRAKGTASSSSCRCGHICPNSSLSSLSSKANTGIRGNPKPSKCGPGRPTESIANSTVASAVCSSDDVFRKPVVMQTRSTPKHLSPNKNFVPCDKALKEQLDKFAQNRKTKGRMKKTVLVQRELPLLPKATPSHSMMTLRIVPTTSQLSGSFILPASSMLNKPTTLDSTAVARAFVSSNIQTGKSADSCTVQTSRMVVVGDPSPIFLQQTTPLLTKEVKQISPETGSCSSVTPNPLMSSMVSKNSPKHILSIESSSTSSVSTANIPQISISESGVTSTLSVSPLTISSLLDISLTGPEANVGAESGASDKLLDITLGNSTSDFCGLMNINNICEIANQHKSGGDAGTSEYRPVTPVNSPTNSLFKFSSPGIDGNSWFNGDASDFSLTNFLNHLESPVKTSNIQSAVTTQPQSGMSTELISNFHGLMNENCIDYTSKFEDLAARK